MKRAATGGDVAAFYASLSSEERAALHHADARLDATEGTDTATTFEKGDALVAARDAVNESTFSKWCAVRWPYHRTYAYRFIRVAERLASHRERLVGARVDRSTLMALASRPERAEELLTAFEEGRRLTFAEVKALIAGDEAGQEPGSCDADAEDTGGLHGLRLLYAAKRRHLKDLTGRLEGIIDAIEGALSAPRVLKGELAAAIKMEARWARAELYNLVTFLEPAPWDALKPTPVQFPKDSGWDRVARLLHDLGGDENWPPRQGMEEWLRGRVLPVLYWAARGEGSATPEAVVGARPISAADCNGEPFLGSPDPVDATAATTDPAEAGVLLDPETTRNCASFLAFLRERFLEEGTPPGLVEETCRNAAAALASVLESGMSSSGRLPGTAALTRLVDEVYRQSRMVPPARPAMQPVRPAVADPDDRPTVGDDPITPALQILARRLVAAAANA